DSVLGRIEIEAEEDVASAILITADGGTNTTMRLHNDTGTGATSIELLTDVGGITATASAGPIVINATGASAGDYTATIGDDYTIAVVGDIDIDSSAGAVTISANAAGQDLNLDSVLGSINIEAEEDAAEAILITADGGTNTTMKLHNDTGTLATSIYMLSDVGGITATASAGAIVLNATGASAGDYTATIGDEYILNVTGGIAITSTETAADAIGLVASTGAGGITLDAGTGGITFSGDTIKNYLPEIEIEGGGSETVLAADSGKIFVSTGSSTGGTVTYTLPTAAAGLTFTFIDASAVAADDVRITASSGDSINGGTVAKSYICKTDAAKQSVTLVAVNAGSWIITSEVGTWANDNVN
ncbi:MAG: hypothetical protein ACYS9Y_12815, partial [Planctomycetota bacterium]